MKQRLLILTDWFYPGFKAGGIITSVHDLAMLLRDEYSIFIMTSDRDLGDSQPYGGVQTDQWTSMDNINVYYASPKSLGFRNIIRQIRKNNIDFIYLSNMYSVWFAIFPLLIKRLGLIRQKIFLSPNGMLQSFALKIKPFKKRLYFALLRLMRIPKFINFHATNAEEQNDITRTFGRQVHISRIAYPPPFPQKPVTHPTKRPGELLLLFLGRVHPVKNLRFLLECLSKMSSRIELKVVGPAEDAGYFLNCKHFSEQLPRNISVTFTGAIPNAQVRNYIEQSHFLALPTTGENFGYAILESFSLGRPVITSANTPWQKLAPQKVGWDLPFNDHSEFIRAIDTAANMDQEEYNEWCDSSQRYIYQLIERNPYKDDFCHMFQPEETPSS